MKFSKETQEYLRILYEFGIPVKGIVKQLGLSETIVNAWIKNYEKRKAEERVKQYEPQQTEAANGWSKHLCWRCYLATNPALMKNVCPWSGLDENGEVRFELPDGATRNSSGKIVSCLLFLLDTDGNKKYGRPKEDIAEKMSLYGDAMNLL